MARDAITDIVLNPTTGMNPVWEIYAPGQNTLYIPMDAEGAEALFDVFNGLPGFRTEEMLKILDNPGKTPHQVWSRRRLH